MTDRSFQRANDESRERLALLVAKLTPTQLATDLGEGWTVASALAHTGFWDRWQAGRWTQMLAGEWHAQDESILEAEHLANDSLHPFWAGIAATDVPSIALEAATRLDALIATAPDDLIDEILAGKSAYLVNRFRHRGDHLDHIERTLAAVAPLAAPIDDGYLARNEAALTRLRATLGRLASADLARAGSDGSWTIGQILGHLTFWDRFLAARWRAARAAGPAEQPGYFPHEVADMINEGLPSTWEAFASAAPDEVIAQTLAAAEEVDAVVAGLAPSIPTGAILAERPAMLDRSIHRSEHLAAIEEIVGTHLAVVERATSGRSQAGQGLAEYALILALMTIIAVSALLILGGGLSTILSVVGAR
jgi:Flp pilus assembly pilin Flp